MPETSSTVAGGRCARPPKTPGPAVALKPGEDTEEARELRRRYDMLLWILLLVLVIVIFGLGFVVKWLFYVAIALFIIWLIMLLVNRSRA